VWAHVPSSSVRSNRMRVYDDFTARWPSLQDWFDAPLADRLLDREGCVPKAHGEFRRSSQRRLIRGPTVGAAWLVRV